MKPYDHLLESARFLDDEAYAEFAEAVGTVRRQREKAAEFREYVVCAIYDDNGQKFTTTVSASSVDEAIAEARGDADSAITIAAVLTGTCIRVEDL